MSRTLCGPPFIMIWSGHSKVVRPNRQCGLARYFFLWHTELIVQLVEAALKHPVSSGLAGLKRHFWRCPARTKKASQARHSREKKHTVPCGRRATDDPPRRSGPANRKAIMTTATSAASTAPPRYILMHDNDNVAIVVNDGGLPAGAVFPSGLTLLQAIPQGHKVALRALAKGDAIVRYNVTIGHAAMDLAAGSWIAEAQVTLPPARELSNLPIATVKPPTPAPLDGYTLRATAIPTAASARATSWPSPPPCSAWPAWSSTRCGASRPNCCRSTPTSTTWSGWSTATAAAWPSTRRTRRCPSARCATSA